MQKIIEKLIFMSQYINSVFWKIKIKKLLNSENYYREATLPIHNNLNKNDVKKISSIVINFVKNFVKQSNELYS